METLRRMCAPTPCLRDELPEAWTFGDALEASRRSLDLRVEADLRDRLGDVRTRTLAAVLGRSEG